MPYINITDAHGVAHAGSASYDQKTVIDTWYVTQLAYLTTELQKISEAGSTALDNSLVLLQNVGVFGHGVNELPIVMVGSAGGAIRTGRVVKVGSWVGKTGNYWTAGNSGVPNNRLLASVMNALGVPGANYGDPRYPGNLNAELGVRA
jgi:hypothetical protein